MRFGQSLEKAALASYEERRASADINVRDSFGRSAIHIAALGGHHRLISVLVNFGADVNAQMPQGRTALMIASGYDHTRTIVELLKNGADVRITDNDSWTCLDYNRTVAVGTSYFAAVQKEEVRQSLLEFSKNESERRPISTILKGYF
jgi:ankyrin repeat protein